MSKFNNEIYASARPNHPNALTFSDLLELPEGTEMIINYKDSKEEIIFLGLTESQDKFKFKYKRFGEITHESFLKDNGVLPYTNEDKQEFWNRYNHLTLAIPNE
jgi:hypothetical protein